MAIADMQATFRHIVLLVVVIVLGHLLVIANPGYFNHDEWQKYDHVMSHGITHFVDAYARVSVGSEFGHPVRPIPFVQQGLSSMLMADWPVYVHSIDVLIHLAVVFLFYAVLRLASIDPFRSFVAAAVFGLSALSAFSTGWVGASMDRWFTFFSLLAFAALLLAFRSGWKWRSLALALSSVSAALLSKETAIMLPAALALCATYLLLQPRYRANWAWACATVGISTLPLLAYLAYRWPAIQATLALPSGPYSASLDNVMPNALAYFAYPFMPRALEMVSMSLLSTWEWGIGIGIHVLLLAMVARRFGIAALAAYLGAYFVFLAPLLVSPSMGAHYLYAAGLPMALVLALVPQSKPIREWLGSAVAGVAVLALVAHGQFIQSGLYRQGYCQSVFLASATPQAKALIAGGASMVRIEGEPGAMTYVALRATFGRDLYAPGGTAAMRIDGEPLSDGEASLVMRSDCSVEASRLNVPPEVSVPSAEAESTDPESSRVATNESAVMQ